MQVLWEKIWRVPQISTWSHSLALLAIFLLSFYIWFVMTGARDLAIRFDLNAMASLGCVACRVYTFKMLQYIWRDMYVHILISQSMHVGFIPSRCYNKFGGICMVHILISQSMCWWIFEVSSIHFPWMVNFFTLCWCFILILYTFIVLSLAWNQSGLFGLFF